MCQCYCITPLINHVKKGNSVSDRTYFLDFCLCSKQFSMYIIKFYLQTTRLTLSIRTICARIQKLLLIYEYLYIFNIAKGCAPSELLLKLLSHFVFYLYRCLCCAQLLEVGCGLFM